MIASSKCSATVQLLSVTCLLLQLVWYGSCTTVQIPWYLRVPYQDVDVTVGDTVVWQWLDDAPHTVTDDTGLFDGPGGGFNGQSGIGFQFSHTFTSPGSYSFYCSYHPNMAGKVNVKEAVQALAPPPKKKAPPPLKKKSPPPLKKAPPPLKKKAPPPLTKKAPPPLKKKAPPPLKNKAPPPLKKKAPPPLKKKAPPPLKKKAPPPLTKKAPPPLKKKAPPPLKKKTPPPLKKKAPPPLK